MRINFPELPFDEIKKNLDGKKYFRIKKRIDQTDKDKFWALGEKAIKFEPFQARMYTHGSFIQSYSWSS